MILLENSFWDLFSIVGLILGLILDVTKAIWDAGWGGKLAIILPFIMIAIWLPIHDSWDTQVKNNNYKNLRDISRALDELKKAQNKFK